LLSLNVNLIPVHITYGQIRIKGVERGNGTFAPREYILIHLVGPPGNTAAKCIILLIYILNNN
jgi:hypothetical protein